MAPDEEQKKTVAPAPSVPALAPAPSVPALAPAPSVPALNEEQKKKGDEEQKKKHREVLNKIYELQSQNYVDYTIKLNKVDEKFADMTLEMMESERQRESRLASVLYWSNLGGNIAFILSHVFLIIGFWLGGWELHRAYKLRKRGAAEQLEIQLNLEGAAFKGSLYGFLVFGVSLALYLAYLRLVYPVVVLR